MSGRLEPFRGFSPGAVAFLAGLRERNDVAWFEVHRPEWERLLLEPMRSLAAEFTEWFPAEVDAGIDVRPRVGGAIGRLRRDTRFTDDKRPYKEAVWLFYRNKRAKVPTLGFFWELNLKGYIYGMGFYAAEPRVLRAIRERALDRPERFSSAIAPVETSPDLHVSGDRYRRSQMPGAPERIAYWLDRKNLYVEAERPHDDILYSPALTDLLWEAWGRLVPLYRFLKG